MWGKEEVTYLRFILIGFLGIFLITILIILSLPFIPFICAYNVGKTIVTTYRENKEFDTLRRNL
jgi:hypothetical protein